MHDLPPGARSSPCPAHPAPPCGPRCAGPRRRAAPRTSSRRRQCSTRRCASSASRARRAAATTARQRTAWACPPSSPSAWTCSVSAGPGAPGAGLGRRGGREGGWRRDTSVEEGSRDLTSPGPLFLRCVSPDTIHTCPSLTHRNLAQLSKVIREGGIVWIILYSFHR